MIRKLVAMSYLNNTTRSRQKRIGMILMLTVLLVTSVVPAHAWYGYRRHRHHVFIAPPVVVPFWAPYAYPPVVVAPPRVYVEPPPSVYIPSPPPQPVWYYCADPPGYY